MSVLRSTLFFIALLALTATTLADEQARYEKIRVEIEEQKRALNQYHRLRDYPSAMERQKEIAMLSRTALELALRSPDISNSRAWKAHANALAEAGLSVDALAALDEYLKTPLLDRSGHLGAWRKRAQIYRRAREDGKALAAYEGALQFVDNPRDRFHILKEQARILLDASNPAGAQELAQKMADLIPRVEEPRQKNFRRDYQSLMTRIFKASGQAGPAREAKWEELKLRLELLQEELERFPQRFPK